MVEEDFYLHTDKFGTLFGHANSFHWDRVYTYRGVARIFQRGGSQTGTPSGDRRLYMVYTAALPRVSEGSVVLSYMTLSLLTSKILFNNCKSFDLLHSPL